jgi:hypothetical protein
MSRKPKPVDPFAGPGVSWDAPAHATPLADMQAVKAFARDRSAPLGERLVVRDEETALSLLLKHGWPCMGEGCTGWREPTPSTGPRVYKCRVCGFEEVVVQVFEEVVG